LHRITSSGPPSRRWTEGNVGTQRDAATGGHAGDGHAHDDRDAMQASPEELPVIDIHLL